MERPVTSRVRVALNALILLAGCLAGTALAVATGPQAHADSVPPPPPGWTTVFGDDFAAPPGGKLEMTASIEQPHPASGLGYWPAAACRRAAGRPSHPE
jgi:hypothetical protein